MIHHGVYGLILCGGRSSRMGIDKAEISYHGMPQKEYLKRILSTFCEQTFFSYKTGSTDEEVILDRYDFDSPLNGILSAFDYEPSKAWLVVSCDMPLIDSTLIETMFMRRNQKDCFTGFYDSANNRAEPMIGIWEPFIYTDLKDFSKKHISPRQFLDIFPTNLAKVPASKYLLNINTPKEYENVIKLLKNE